MTKPASRNTNMLKPYPVTRNSRVLESFVDYCVAHPEQRFWQALRNWAGVLQIGAYTERWGGKNGAPEDTFYWEGRDGT